MTAMTTHTHTTLHIHSTTADGRKMTNTRKSEEGGSSKFRLAFFLFYQKDVSLTFTRVLLALLASSCSPDTGIVTRNKSTDFGTIPHFTATPHVEGRMWSSYMQSATLRANNRARVQKRNIDIVGKITATRIHKPATATLAFWVPLLHQFFILRYDVIHAASVTIPDDSVFFFVFCTHIRYNSSHQHTFSMQKL